MLSIIAGCLPTRPEWASRREQIDASGCPSLYDAKLQSRYQYFQVSLGFLVEDY